VGLVTRQGTHTTYIHIMIITIMHTTALSRAFLFHEKGLSWSGLFSTETSTTTYGLGNSVGRNFVLPNVIEKPDGESDGSPVGTLGHSVTIENNIPKIWPWLAFSLSSKKRYCTILREIVFDCFLILWICVFIFHAHIFQIQHIPFPLFLTLAMYG